MIGVLMIFAGSLLHADPLPSVNDAISERWKAISERSVWQSPTVQDRENFREGMQQLVATADSCQASVVEQAQQPLSEAGFIVERLQTAEGLVLLVSEVPQRSRGGGLYAIRCGEAVPLVIQAPHAFFDQRTGYIARHLFAEGSLRMGAWNTVHRYRSRPDEERSDEVHPADVAHEFGSFYQAATVAAAMALPDLRFVQLHGYADGRVEQDAILSTGDATLPPSALAENLGDALGELALFGVHTQRLGGVSNAQGRFLAHWPTGRFLHLELSATTRKTVASDAAMRAALLAALQEPWR